MSWPVLLSILLATSLLSADPGTSSERTVTITSLFGSPLLGKRSIVVNSDGTVSRHRYLFGLYEGPDCPPWDGGRVDYGMLASLKPSDGASVVLHEAYTSPSLRGVRAFDADATIYFVNVRNGVDPERDYEIELDEQDAAVPRAIRALVALFDKAMRGCPIIQPEGVTVLRPNSVRWSVDYETGGDVGGWEILIDSDGRTRYSQGQPCLLPFLRNPVCH